MTRRRQPDPERRAWAPGRPATGTPRDRVLPPVRVSEAEREQIARLAEAAGVSVSEWVRSRALSTG